MQQLQPGTTLQSGKNRIERPLALGDFSISNKALIKGIVSNRLGTMGRYLLFFLLSILFHMTIKAQNIGGEIHRPQQQQSQPVRKPSKSVKSQQQISTNRTEASTTPAKNRDAIIQNLINNMVFVEGGTFTMGATPEQNAYAIDFGMPAHQVTLSSFSIGKYEVTQEEWEAVMGSNPSNFKGAKRPVEEVSWNDCQAFISKLNELTGRNFRLPTEAEWEFAARGGNKSKGYKYAGSDNLSSVAWYYNNNTRYGTHDVGTKLPNELGLYDMSGNIFEWCQDWYNGSYYNSSPSSNPKGPSSGSDRVNRGGSWTHEAYSCCVFDRSYYTPDDPAYAIGLRLVMPNTNLNINSNTNSNIYLSPVYSNNTQVGSSDKIYYSPSVLLNVDKDLTLKSVHLKSDRTILALSFKNDSGSAWINIDKNAYIMVDGKKYYLLEAQGIAYAPKHTNLSYQGEIKTFELHFMPIPKDTSKMDFVESKESPWKMYSISLK